VKGCEELVISHSLERSALYLLRNHVGQSLAQKNARGLDLRLTHFQSTSHMILQPID
jgi:hypothetical protein